MSYVLEVETTVWNVSLLLIEELLTMFFSIRVNPENFGYVLSRLSQEEQRTQKFLLTLNFPPLSCGRLAVLCFSERSLFKAVNNPLVALLVEIFGNLLRAIGKERI